MMTFVDPARFGNERQALHPETSHPGFGDFHEPPKRKRKRMRCLIRRILGWDEKQDQ